LKAQTRYKPVSMFLTNVRQIRFLGHQVFIAASRRKQKQSKQVVFANLYNTNRRKWDCKKAV